MKRLILPAAIVFLFGVLLGTTLGDAFLRTPDSAQLRKVEEAYRLIAGRYVDDIDTDKLTESAIFGMLEGLDPHSNYISAAEIQAVQDGFRGEFGGVGIWYELVADTPRVSSTVPEGPSERAGVLPGDRIVTINGTSSVGDSSRTVQRRLKGAIGTDVSITVKRRGADDDVPITITRGRIPLLSVDAAYMLDDSTGLIKIGRFATTTHREFMESAAELTGLGMQRLIIDLRNNPGGIMETAVAIADELIPEGFDIVSTRSRDRSIVRTERATRGGLLERIPLLVLINENSASASEILAGAIQDTDRGILIGERTFGKALVQQQFPLDDGSYIHLTVSRYYTPSGRLIQTPYEGADMHDYLERKFENAAILDAEKVPDSLRYSTAAGRTVAGGGGVLPDRIVQIDSSSVLLDPLFRRLNARIADIRFVRDLFDREQDAWRSRWESDQDRFMSAFSVDAALMNRFWEFVDSQDLLGSYASNVTARDRARVEPSLKILLKARIAQNIFGSSAYYPVIQPLDTDLMVARDAWPDAVAFATGAAE